MALGDGTGADKLIDCYTKDSSSRRNGNCICNAVVLLLALLKDAYIVG